MDHDAIARDLGKLIAKAEEAERQRSAMFGRIDDLRKEMSETKGVSNEAMRRIAMMEQKVQEDIKPTVEDYKALKNRGLGMIAMVGLMGAAIGASSHKIAEFIKGLF